MGRLALPAAILASLLWSASSALAQAILGQDIVVNGGFEQDADNDGWPDGWPRAQGTALAREGGNSWLVVSQYGGPTQAIALQPDWARLRLTFRMRTTDVVLGDEGWKDGRLAMNFTDDQDRHLDPWPDVFHGVGTTDWARCEREYRIPEGATRLLLSPNLYGTAGKVEFDDIRLVVSRLRSQAKEDVPAPEGATGLWDLTDAWRQTTPTRERISLNDLWRFLPLSEEAGQQVPGASEGWGWFKVPGIWPTSAEGQAQRVWLSGWSEDRVDLARVEQAWYRRSVAIPADWTGRRILIDFSMVQTHARVYVNGAPCGEVWFPGGRVDLTSAVRPGATHDVAVLVTARPLESETHTFMAPDRVVASQARIDLRGLTGDVTLESEPPGPRIDDVHVITTTRDRRITLDVGLGLAPGESYQIAVDLQRDGQSERRFRSPVFTAADLKDGRYTFSSGWRDVALWDTDHPGNLYDALLTLSRAEGEVVDQALPERFGFREFRIEGRDFLLNDKPIHLRALLVENMNQAADRASEGRAEETCRRLRDYGFNFFITGNYHFRPGAVGYMDGLLEAADRTGTLCSFSLPHVTDYRIDLEKPESQAAYRALAEWLIRRVQNHPAVVMYAMNHNSTGYYGDQDPLRIDGKYLPDADLPPDNWSARNRRLAPIAAGIAHSLDPTRPVYHHQSGNLGDMHTVNLYLNWAPMQERSDWLEHWATEGAKPVFFVEWGLPHISSWSSYRGPKFIWTNDAYQWIWDSEYSAAYVGQEAYRMTPTKVRSMALEEELWARGQPFAWGNLNQYLSSQEENYLSIQALFASHNWRAHRTWGLSAGLPWDQGGLWAPNPGVADAPQDVPDALGHLKQPGIAPDRLLPGGDYLTALNPQSRVPTSLGRAFLRWNMPLCAYIGGGPTSFTDEAANYRPGETVRKQLVVLNDTRAETVCRWSWRLTPGQQAGEGTVTVAPSDKALIPVEVALDASAPAVTHTLSARFAFADGAVQEDSFTLHVMPAPRVESLVQRVALFDPRGETEKLLQSLGVRFELVQADTDLSPYRLLVIGREAITPGDPAPDLSGLARGLRVLVFEQSYDTLTGRFGFRCNIQGLRSVFVRAPGHPALEGLSDDTLANWHGASTLTPAHLPIEGVELTDPTWNWMGFANTHVWRCGNRGNVASVLIEKPERGDFLPLLDGGFDLQYAPLLEYTEGAGRMVFCQLDVTDRTEPDPAADRLCLNLLRYLDSALAAVRRPVRYAGDERGAKLLADLGVTCQPAGPEAPSADSLLVLGPAASVFGLDTAVQQGLLVLGLGLDEADLARLLPGEVAAAPGPAVSSLLGDVGCPEFAGLSSAELHWKTRPTIASLKTETPDASGALAVLERGAGRIVLCQAAPWVFDYSAKPYLRTTYRRNVFLVSRLLANLGAESRSPLLERIARPGAVYDWQLPAEWRGITDQNDVGKTQRWERSDFDDSAWKPIKVSATFESQIPELADYDGLFWYRLRFRVPPGLPTQGVTLELGPVDDESWVWLNGQFLGEVTKATNPEDYWSFPRRYPVPPGMLRPDSDNVLVVRCLDTYLQGGITGQPRLAARAPWLDSYYLQTPESVDDPYRYYRW